MRMKLDEIKDDDDAQVFVMEHMAACTEAMQLIMEGMRILRAEKVLKLELVDNDAFESMEVKVETRYMAEGMRLVGPRVMPEGPQRQQLAFVKTYYSQVTGDDAVIVEITPVGQEGFLAELDRGDVEEAGFLIPGPESVA